MKKRYGLCICHDKLRSLNARGLCPIGAKEAREKSAESKGLTVKKKEDDINRSIKKDSRDRPSIRLLGQKIRKTPINKAKTKIKPISKDKAIEVALLAEIKSKKIHEMGKVCEMCGKHGEVDLFHIIGVGDKRFATDERNTMLSCREPCHNAWTNNDWSKVVKFRNFSEIMERLKSLDDGKYWKLWHKIEPFLNS